MLRLLDYVWAGDRLTNCDECWNDFNKSIFVATIFTICRSQINLLCFTNGSFFLIKPWHGCSLDTTMQRSTFDISNEIQRVETSNHFKPASIGGRGMSI